MTAIILTTGATRKGSAEISEEVGENRSMIRGRGSGGRYSKCFEGGVVCYRVSYVVS